MTANRTKRIDHRHIFPTVAPGNREIVPTDDEGLKVQTSDTHFTVVQPAVPNVLSKIQ